MKTRETTPGKTYSVHTMKGCTIIEPDGWSKTIEAPDGYFDAHFGSVVIEGDDEASIKQLFKLAPQQRLTLLGVLGGDVPAWFKALETELTALLDGSKFELAWPAGEKKLVVHTDRVSDELSDAVTALLERVLPQNIEVVRYNHNMEISWRDINKYAHCKNDADLLAVNPDYASDLTSSGEWVYLMPELEKWETKGTSTGLWYKDPKLKKWGVPCLPKLKTINNVFRYCTLSELRINMPSLTRAGWILDGIYIKLFEGDLSSVQNGDIFARWSTNLEDFKAELPALSSGIDMFNSCKLNKESALRVLNSIPAWTRGSHPLTIGIHIDHKTDEEVLAAIANAEAKGWTLTVQWNGTPTAQAATMAMGQLIYAKVGEMENGERYLDWGHYVTDWEARGYEQFRSLASAYSYFNLPDETLTNN